LTIITLFLLLTKLLNLNALNVLFLLSWGLLKTIAIT